MKKWRCTVCGYIHKGDTPPDVCPVCGVGPEFFEPVADDPDSTIIEEGREESQADKQIDIVIGQSDPKKMQSALYKISYGLFIVTSVKGNKINGQCANTVFQITSEPMRVALGINKSNLTNEFIKASGVVGITILGEDGHDLVRKFGYSSGRDRNKFDKLDYMRGTTGVPIIKGGIAFLEGKILKDKTLDVGTHDLFIAEIVDGAVIEEKDAMTYAYFRKTK